MSKLIEALKKVTQLEAPRMGFGTRRDESRTSRPLLMAITGDISLKTLGKLKDSGADGIVLLGHSLNKPEREQSKLLEALNGLPAGVWLQRPMDASGERVLRGEWDFLIFDMDASPAPTLGAKDPGKLLQVDSGLEESLLRATAALPVDGLFYTLREEALAVRHLLALARIGQFIRKPVVVLIPQQIDPKALELLRDAGASGIAIEVKDEEGIKQVQRLQQELEKLPPRKKPGETREARLPQMAAAGEAGTSRTAPLEPDEEEDY